MSLDVQKKHQIIREQRKTRKTRKFHDALAVQAAVGVVVVGALHDTVLPHDATDAAQVVADVEVEGRQARRSIERGVGSAWQDMQFIHMVAK